jgi:hypothetical protein
MSLFSWFKSKPQAHRGYVAAAHATPMPPAAGARDPSAAHAGESAADTATRRKNERARLRDLLYNVVRESMVRVGVLSSSFKFKVLATDPRGRKFIVMMDLSRDFGSEISQLAEIEALICQSAKARHNIVVSSVYWRAEDPVAGEKAESTHPEAKYRAVVPQAAPAAVQEKKAPAPSDAKFDPVLADEVMALKRALTAGGADNSKPLSAVPVPVPAAPRTEPTGYESTEFMESRTQEAHSEIAETEMLDDEVQYPALSATQYGELR